ncbi:unnamed protein product [Zymoseptoria tritici ST99CH_1A5]|uniref:MARVEL domain-containing protein n=3 Tax=Zymoseptoria tritici TaxID=1047171 RepID=A0A1X7RRV7_ZYMT9|nr:unnamed protein product [Zymoseptoria tritici ST99CH_3D7]SMR51151.1 unnamed protein product [Zymoseptoria tritici ST99CH_1E4]SMR52108.1 unnamed protein product [Zymoseptoria tritici ST99CH_3D1]SMY23845.1 unnamed protein product [Zymoseptoria tritici ST99CH_1A5]
MGVSGFLFISWRLFELVTLIPIVGMLAYFVHGFVERNQLTPNFILVLFIVSVLALAWVFFTLISYLRARHDALFVAFVDLCFVAALIAGVVVMRRIANADCANFETGSIFVNLGPFGYYGRQGGDRWALNLNKNCAMLKASWALAIINILAFCVTFVLALLVHRNHRNEDKVVVKREYHTSRHSHRRSASRDHRSSRDGGRRSTHRSSSRRQYYV